MEPTQLSIIGAGVPSLFIFLSGFWLTRAKKPYPMVLMNAHKLIGLAAGILMGITVYQIYQATPLGSAEAISVVITGLLFVTTVIAGGLLTIERVMPPLLSSVHRLFPYLTVLAATYSLYLIFV